MATLAVAGALHALLLAFDATDDSPRPESSAPSLELDLLSAAEIRVEFEPRGVELAPRPPRDAGHTAVATGLARVVSPAPASIAPGAPTAEMTPAPLPAAPGVHASPRKAINLFLGQKDLAELARRNTRPERPPEAASTPSVGGLSEGLDALDAEQGLSRSSPAVSACYRAADLAPEVGTAVLEVRTDARGAVTAVKVLGDGAATGWGIVADGLLARLKDRLLRVPEGARGLVTRLRIDRGWLAEDLAARGRTKRGVAIGQDHHPKDFGWDESTQAGSSRGRLTPSLGVSSEDLRKSVKTRVSVVSEQAL